MATPECRKCGMVFAGAAELSNHDQNFCVDAPGRKEEADTLSPEDREKAFQQLKAYIASRGPRDDPKSKPTLATTPLEEIGKRFNLLRPLVRDSDDANDRLMQARSHELAAKVAEARSERQVLAEENAKLDEELKATVQQMRQKKREAVDVQMEKEKLEKELQHLDQGRLAALTEEGRQQVQSLQLELRKLRRQDERLASQIEAAKDQILHRRQQYEKGKERGSQSARLPPTNPFAVEQLLSLAKRQAAEESELVAKHRKLHEERTKLESDWHALQGRKETTHTDAETPPLHNEFSPDALAEFVKGVEQNLDADREHLRVLQESYQETIQHAKAIEAHPTAAAATQPPGAEDDAHQEELPSSIQRIADNVAHTLDRSPEAAPHLTSAVQQALRSAFACEEDSALSPAQPQQGPDTDGAVLRQRSTFVDAAPSSARSVAGDSSLRGKTPGFGGESASDIHRDDRPPSQASHNSSDIVERYIKEGGCDPAVLQHLIGLRDSPGKPLSLPPAPAQPAAPAQPPAAGVSPLSAAEEDILRRQQHEALQLQQRLHAMQSEMRTLDAHAYSPPAPRTPPPWWAGGALPPYPYPPPVAFPADATPPPAQAPAAPATREEKAKAEQAETGASGTGSGGGGDDSGTAMLRQLVEQERMQLEALMRLPPDSDLYALRHKHFQEMTGLRCEIEKTLQEKTLEELRLDRDRAIEARRRQEREEAWLEEQKRTLIELEVKKRLAREGERPATPPPEDQPYDPSKGFYIYWDFIEALPLRFNRCRIAYAFYDGPSALSSVKATHTETALSIGSALRVTFASSRLLTLLPGAPNARLVLEVQFEPQTAKDTSETSPRDEKDDAANTPTAAQVVPVGWTAVEVFDGAGRLRAGRYQCPVLRPPPLVAAPSPVLAGVERIADGCRVFMRIGYVDRHIQDTRWKIDATAYMQATGMALNDEYAIPSILQNGQEADEERARRRKMAKRQDRAEREERRRQRQRQPPQLRREREAERESFDDTSPRHQRQPKRQPREEPKLGIGVHVVSLEDLALPPDTLAKLSPSAVPPSPSEVLMQVLCGLYSHADGSLLKHETEQAELWPASFATKPQRSNAQAIKQGGEDKKRDGAKEAERPMSVTYRDGRVFHSPKTPPDRAPGDRRLSERSLASSSLVDDNSESVDTEEDANAVMDSERDRRSNESGASSDRRQRRSSKVPAVDGLWWPECVWVVLKVIARVSDEQHTLRSTPPSSAEQCVVAWTAACVPRVASLTRQDLSLPLFWPPAQYPPYPPQGPTDAMAFPLQTIDQFLAIDGSTLKVILYHPSLHQHIHGEAEAAMAKETPLERPLSPVSEEKERESEKELQLFVAHEAVPNDELYDPETDGFDIYMDQIRFPPEAALACRVVLRVISSSFSPILDAMGGISSLSSHRIIHRLDPPLYMDYRKGPIDPTALLMIRVDCLDRFLIHDALRKTEGEGHTNVSPFVAVNSEAEREEERDVEGPGAPCRFTWGFAVLPLFVKQRASGGGQPDHPTEQSFCLNEGAFQLGLSLSPYPKYSPEHRSVNATSLDDKPKVPCASVLIRVVSAPKSPDGLKLYRRSNVDPSEWPHMGLQADPPQYEDAVYDTTRFVPSPDEHKLFDKYTPLLRELEAHQQEQDHDEGDDDPQGVPADNEQPMSEADAGGGEDAAASSSSARSEDQMEGEGDKWSVESGSQGAAGEPQGRQRPAEPMKHMTLLDELLRLRRRFPRETGTISSPNRQAAMSERALKHWLRVQFGSPNLQEMRLLNDQHVLPYDKTVGFRVNIDCVHGFRKDAPLVVLHSLFPPGGLYEETPLLEDTHFTTRRDFSFSIRSPRFVTQWTKYKPSKMSRYSTLIVDVRWLNVKASRSEGLFPWGWFVIPLFDNHGFLMSNCYQVPLFQGAVSQDALSELKETMIKHEQLQQQQPQPSAPTSTAQLPSIRKLMDKWLQYNWADERKVAKWDKWSSVFVRLVDGQLEHDRRYSRPGYQLMAERLDRSFLPYGRSGSYAYDAKKIPKRTLNLLTPRGETNEEYERRMNEQTQKATGITRYAF
ncbi:unnamed protein product [Vitrella brassicaformis CCMP3155]|uniref:Uncharacterized protein n=3 Tax=Vitrella brassicaformis TaxID=1169539 RepID=A0A0G4FJM5_VITBC|nr:unnamed protein product [Vitrella brassicaformis CCMP3155]|eukprot:CEM13893.1 unnamed protein product [Vitrella brassicaformis CCMP3155]